MEYNVQKAQIFIRSCIIIATQTCGKFGGVMKQHPQMWQGLLGMKHPHYNLMQPQSKIAEVSGEGILEGSGYFREEMGKIWGRGISCLQGSEMHRLPASVVGYTPAPAWQPLHG